MKIAQFCYFCVIFLLLNDCHIVEGLGAGYLTKKSRCLNPPRTARRVETYIQECQEEVKVKLINEAFQILKDEVAKDHPPLDAHDDSVQFIEVAETLPSLDTQPALAYSYEEVPDAATTPQFEYLTQYEEQPGNERVAHLMQRMRRIGVDTVTGGIYHPTLVPFEDKRIAGCLLHCVYAKNNAIDKLGWPTLDGLVDFYSEGVNEHGFFMATLRSVNLCLRAVTNKYRVNRRKLPEKGESCDLAFDVFDCISDQITGYCLDHYK